MPVGMRRRFLSHLPGAQNSAADPSTSTDAPLPHPDHRWPQRHRRSREHLLKLNNDPANWGLTRFTWVSNWDTSSSRWLLRENLQRWHLPVARPAVGNSPTSWPAEDLANSPILPPVRYQERQRRHHRHRQPLHRPRRPRRLRCRHRPPLHHRARHRLHLRQDPRQQFSSKRPTSAHAARSTASPRATSLEIVFKAYDQQEGGLWPASAILLHLWQQPRRRPAPDRHPGPRRPPPAPFPPPAKSAPPTAKRGCSGRVAPVWTGGYRPPPRPRRSGLPRNLPATSCSSPPANSGTVVNCDHNGKIGNLSEYSFIVVV